MKSRGLPDVFTRRNLRRAVWASLWCLLENDDYMSVLELTLKRLWLEEEVATEQFIAINGGLNPSPQTKNAAPSGISAAPAEKGARNG